MPPCLDYDGRFLPRLGQDDSRLVETIQLSHILQRQRGSAPHVNQSKLAATPSHGSAKVSSTMAELSLHDNEKRVDRLDRRGIARRQLMGGLKTSVSPDRDPNRGSLRRSQSFNKQAGQSGSGHWQRASGPSHCSVSPDQSKRSLRGLSSVKTTTVSDTIHNWNELVHELNASHRVPPHGSQPHLEIVSSDSSDSLSSPSANILKNKTPNNISDILPHRSLQTSALSTTRGTFPTGIGITRYRPITPNLLVSLEKKKQNPRRRTQLWLQQVQVHRRAHRTLSMEDSSHGDVDEQHNLMTSHISDVGLTQGRNSGRQRQGFL